ncbi:MAG: ribose-phosphate pyrophosphokinase [Legionellales bacterium]|nr:ribose-phosphate pyrophosphokinase [Legionellales bacterium]
MDNIKIFSGNSNVALATSIVNYLGLSLGQVDIGRFSDGEIRVEIKENVRGKDIFVIQSTSSPCNDNLMELMILADALRRASAASITVVMPYFGYARADRRVRSARVAITAKVVADMLSSVGVSRCVTVDLHAEQIQGFFSMPVDNIYATPIMRDDIQNNEKLRDSIIVAPDIGGVVRARAIAKRLDKDFAIIDKRRFRHNQVEVLNIIGDVSGKDCIIVDDMVDTAGTLCQAAEILKNNGASSVIAYCTHPVLSGGAGQTVLDSKLDELVVTDTIACSEEVLSISKIRQLKLGSLIAETINRLISNKSISSMFID